MRNLQSASVCCIPRINPFILQNQSIFQALDVAITLKLPEIIGLSAVV
jgi:hypothetical protein